MRIIFVIGPLPSLQGNLKRGDRIKFPYPNQILLDGTNNQLRIGVAPRVAVTGEYLMNLQLGTCFEKSR